MTCHWADPMGGDGSPWGDPSGVFSPFPAHPSAERCWKYVLIFIASLGLELLTEEIHKKWETMRDRIHLGYLAFSLLFWWINPPNLHGPSEASHLRSAQAGHVLLPFERAAHQSLRGGPAIRDDPPNRNLRMPKRNWLGIIYIYDIYIYNIYMCVCVFSYDMIKWSIHLYYDDSSKLSSQRIVHVFPCFSARLEAERIGFGFCAIPRVRSSWSILWCRRRQNQLRFIVDICGWMSLACRIWLIMVYYGDSAG